MDPMRRANLSPATRPASQLERLLLYALVGLIVGYGILVELRSAGLSRRMGDLEVYLRAAWAARIGADIYTVTDENDWHYNYPPLYALLLVPLAEPPAGFPRAGYVPYPISVALFYLLNIGLLFGSAHILARTLEETSALGDQPRFCRRWWALRLWPILFCLPPAAQTSMRGQVNHIILALLCLSIAAVTQRRRVWAGALLALAVCIKVIPVYLVVYPVWKRDLRALAGCALGLLAGLVLVPLALQGPSRTMDQYQRYTEVFFGPVFGMGSDDSRQDELLGINATDSVGLKNAIYNWCYFDRAQRPPYMPAQVVWAYRVLGFLMTLLVLWPRGGAGRGPGFEATQFSALILLMAILSPICHLHYLVFCLPLVLCLLARQWQSAADLRLHPGLACVLLAFTAANIVPSLPGLDRLKDLCVNMFAALPIWCAGVVALWRWPALTAGVGFADALPTPRRAA